MLFKDLNFEEFRGKRVFVDVDGTLVPDGTDELAPAEAHALAVLSGEAREVFLVSSRGVSRLPELAKRYGVDAVISECRKPNVCMVSHIPKADGAEVVIGDMVMTDGLFASRIGASFVRTDRIQNEHTRFEMQCVYFIDDVIGDIVRVGINVVQSRAWGYVYLLHPRQWAKNVLIFAPAFFAGIIFDPDILGLLGYALIAFSATASVGYIVNDTADRHRDALHPRKKRRPLASGAVSSGEAYSVIFILALIALFAGAQVPSVLPWISIYLTLSFLYSSVLKLIPFIELFVAPFFYVIRIATGAAVASVVVSPWVVALTFFGALFLTVGRRHSESLKIEPGFAVRKYPHELFHTLHTLTASVVVVLYTTYTLIATDFPALLYTVPLVLLAMALQLYTAFRSVRDDPELRLWAALGLWGTVLVWMVSVGVIVY